MSSQSFNIKTSTRLKRFLGWFFNEILFVLLVVSAWVTYQSTLATDYQYLFQIHVLCLVLYLLIDGFILPATRLQASVAMWVMGLKIVNQENAKIGLFQLLGWRILNGLIGITSIAIFFTENAQSLTDLIVGTYVVERKLNPEE